MGGGAKLHATETSMKTKPKSAKKSAKLQDLKARKDVKGGGGIPRSTASRIAQNHNETFLRG